MGRVLHWVSVLLLILAASALGKERCKRFDTIQVLQRFYHKRTDIPLSPDEAVQAGWKKVGRYKPYRLDIYCYKEYTSLLIFFYQDQLAGVGPTVKLKHWTVKEDNENKRHHLERIGLLRAILGRLWQFFVSIKEAYKRESIFNHEIVINKVKVRYGMILFINPGYYYFYNLRKDTGCSKVHGFFAVYSPQGVLWGFGAMMFGESNIEDYPHPFPVYTTTPIPYMYILPRLSVYLCAFLVTVPEPSCQNIMLRAFNLECKGFYQKHLYAKMDLVCEDCGNSLQSGQLEYECRLNCFANFKFGECLTLLQKTPQEIVEYQKIIMQIHGNPIEDVL